MKRHRKIRLLQLGAAPLVAGMIAASCGHQSPADARAARAAHAKGDILIGVAWPWATRKEIHFGDGLQLAVDQINAGGGIGGRRLSLVRVDDHESVDHGRMVAQQLADNLDVVAVIGDLESYVAVPASAIYSLSGMVMIAPTATDPALTSGGYPRIFRETLTEPEIGRQLADFAKMRGYHRVAICYIRDNYGRGLANAFEERAMEVGLTVIARQSYDASGDVTMESFEPALADWKRQDPDVIFLAGEVPSAGLFIAEARKDGITAPIIGGDALSSPALMQEAGAAAEGTVVGSLFHPDEPRPEVRRFSVAFQERYGARPDAGAALGYDAVQMLAQAMRAAKSTVPDSISKALHHLRDWPGVTGAVSFDSVGNLIGRTVVMLVVHDGQFDYLPVPPTTTPSNEVALRDVHGQRSTP